MKTNYGTFVLEEDDVEVCDANNNSVNVLTMLLGLILPLIVFFFILLRTAVNVLAKSVAAIIVFGRSAGSHREARSPSTVTGR